MELKQFISQTLTSIVEGVAEAQAQTEAHGAFVNPGGLMRTTKSISNDAIWDNRNNNFARLVNFDVAVTIEESAGTGGKIGVATGLLNLGAGGESTNRTSAANRIQFSVPLLLPTTELPEDSRHKKITLKDFKR